MREKEGYGRIGDYKFKKTRLVCCKCAVDNVKAILGVTFLRAGVRSPFHLWSYSGELKSKF